MASTEHGSHAITGEVERFLRGHLPFSSMEEEALRFLASHLDLGYYPAGTVILDPASDVPQILHIIQRGTVQVTPFAGQGGDAQPVSLGSGECFSVSAMLEKRAVVSPYTAVTDVFSYEFPAAKFPELLDRSPVFRDYATSYLASMLRESRRLIKMNAIADAGAQQAMSRTLRSLIGRPPVTCAPETTVEEVLRTMQNRKIGSMLIVDQQGGPQGIFTRHDVLDRVALARCDLKRPISDIMTGNPNTLPAEASAYEAAVMIAHHGIRHIPVCDGGQLIGVITERDLFALQRVSVRAINRTINAAETIAELQRVARDIHRLARSMSDQGVTAEQLTLIISTLNDALVRRILDIQSANHALAGVRWCWLAFGSEGRYEQTISTDQDNGLIFDAGDASPDAVRARLLPFAQAVNQDLDACGFPLCKGNIMAGNPHWCLGLDEWRGLFSAWIGNTDPQALLQAVIFFDFRPIHGEESLARSLRDHLTRLAQETPRFQRQLAQYALETRPPLGMIGDFVTEDAGGMRNTIDLKKSAARLFTDAARVLALAAGVRHTSTAQRLRQAGPILKMQAMEVASICDAFFFLQTMRLRNQMATDAVPGMSNRISVDQLNEVDRRILKESLRQVRKLQSRIALDYQL